MKLKRPFIGILLILLVLLGLPPLNSVRAQTDFPPEGTAQPTQISVDVVNEYYAVMRTTLADGTQLTADLINGPSEPPNRAAWEASRVSVASLDRAATLLPSFPSYSWVFGCSAVSGAMVAAYYDTHGYPALYSGPTNGGVMPLSDTSWPAWQDSVNHLYPNNPLIASHNGVDGRSENGSIDDYWVSYLSSADDPYLTYGWSQHASGTAIGDYMKTSQSAFDNMDGSTVFWNYTSSTAKMSCAMMAANSWPDGTLGRKEFYEARGYTVTECYNQRTENIVPGTFSLADFQAEINAGNPVLINLEGHSVVGYGYDGSTIYIRDTWDNNPGSLQTMPWGGFYQDMEMLSVSIVHLDNSPTFSKLSPANAFSSPSTTVTLSWGNSVGVDSYAYCLSTSSSCSNWVSTDVDTSVTLADLTAGATYFWQVQAVDGAVTTYADGSASAYWQFTTDEIVNLTEKNFIPLIIR